MTSRERVIRTLRRQKVDRMPIDLGMHYSTGISAFAYWNLREHLGLSTDNIVIPDMIQFLARVDEDVMQRFHVDCILLHPGWQQTHRWRPRGAAGRYDFVIPKTAQPQLQPDGSWLLQRNGASLCMPAGGFFFDGGWPGFSDDTTLDRTAREAERIYKETPYATFWMGFGAYFSQDPDWLCRMIEEPEKILEENEAQCQRDIEYAGLAIETMGKYVQGFCLNSDLGAQNGPICSLAHYQQFSAPFVKRLCDFIHRNSDCKTFLHCCGSIKPLIPTLIDSGIDALNPVQISASNMDPRQLKSELGNKIVFWGGGCNTQAVLGRKTPQEVAQHVRELVSIFKPGGGFVFNQVHNIMGDVPPENIVAMLDTAYAESFYSAE